MAKTKKSKTKRCGNGARIKKGRQIVKRYLKGAKK